MKIDWSITVQAFALLGYEFNAPHGFNDQPAHVQLAMWDMFLESYVRCQLECAWKGGGPCIDVGCPRQVLRRVSMSALPLTPIRLNIE